MEHQYRVLLQDENEGTWDQVYTGDFSDCMGFIEKHLNEEDEMGLVKVEEIMTTLTQKEMRVVKMAVSEYYLNLMNMVTDSDEYTRYYKEEKELINKIERLNK